MSMALNVPGDAEGRGGKRAIVLAIVLALALTAVYFSPVKTWLRNADQMHRLVQSLGIWIYPLGVLATAILVGCGVPRLLLCGVGGMTLGFWKGIILAEMGTVLGYYGLFLFVRWGGRDWAL